MFFFFLHTKKSLKNIYSWMHTLKLLKVVKLKLYSKNVKCLFTMGMRHYYKIMYVSRFYSIFSLSKVNNVWEFLSLRNRITFIHFHAYDNWLSEAVYDGKHFTVWHIKCKCFFFMFTMYSNLMSTKNETLKGDKKKKKKKGSKFGLLEPV